MTDRIHLGAMVFQGHHGYSEEEREQPQPFEVDVLLSLDLAPAGGTDDLAMTVDYAVVYRLVREVVESTSFRLLETLAEAIAQEVLSGHARVDAVEVRVRKPRVQLGGPIGRAGVEIHRRRAGGSDGLL